MYKSHILNDLDIVLAIVCIGRNVLAKDSANMVSLLYSMCSKFNYKFVVVTSKDITSAITHTCSILFNITFATNKYVYTCIYIYST